MSDKNRKYYPDKIDESKKAADAFKEILKREDTDRVAETIACAETQVDRTGAIIPCKKGGK